jgi:protoporphyrinogen oxidase
VTKIVIIGSGLTGLSAAFHLEQAGCFDYAIFEKDDRPGGLLKSFEQDRFTFDYTGHFLHLKSLYFRNFLSYIVGMNNLSLIKRQSAIHLYNSTVNYPFQMNLYGLPSKVVYECIEGFIRKKKSIHIPETFYDWVLKYFGRGIGEHFFFPYNTKLLSYDIKKVSPSWTGRFVPKVDLREVLQGALSMTEERWVGYNSLFYYPKSGGIEFIIKKLVGSIKNEVKKGFKATQVDLASKIVYFENGHRENFDYLINTMPLNKLLSNVKGVCRADFKQAAEKLLCNSVINFNLGFDVEDISTKHWLYFPEKKFLFYRLGFWNNINKTSVKNGCSAIYGELAYLPKTKKQQNIDSFIHKSIDQAVAFLSVKKSNVIIEKILPIEHAYVIYDKWREKNISKIHCDLNSNGIYSIGRFGEWKYSTMEDAVLDGKRVAEILSKKIFLLKGDIIPSRVELSNFLEQKTKEVITKMI